MTSISGLSSNYVQPSTALQGSQSVQGSGSDPDGDAGQSVKRHGGHGHGGGQMQDALAQALQSLGLTAASGTTATTGSTSTTGTSSTASADSDGDSDGSGSTSATGNIKSDMRQFMQAYTLAFSAVIFLLEALLLRPLENRLNRWRL